MMLKKALSLVATFLAIGISNFMLAAERLPMVQPEDVGFDSEKLERIVPFFNKRVEEGEIAGIVTLVARHGKVVHLSAVGYADAYNKTPMQTDTLFRLYSMTKPIAATALMMLFEEGAFQLTDPLSDYIPEFSNLRVLRTPDSALDDTVILEREPTIQDALRHTAGFTHGLGVEEMDNRFVQLGIYNPDTSLEEMMSALSELPLRFQPGSQYGYAIGHDIALRLVEIITGMPIDEYMEQRLFEPLGMDDTAYWVTEESSHRLSPVHWRKDGELVPIDEVHGHPQGGVLVQPWSVNSYTWDQEYKGGSIGLVSTAADYWRFAQTMLNGGELDGHGIMGSRIVDFMRRNHLPDQQRVGPTSAIGYGLGFGVIEDSTRFGFPISEGSFYWSGAASTNFWIDPSEDLIVVSMTQHMRVAEAGSIRAELGALVYGALQD